MNDCKDASSFYFLLKKKKIFLFWRTGKYGAF